MYNFFSTQWAITGSHSDSSGGVCVAICNRSDGEEGVVIDNG